MGLYLNPGNGKFRLAVNSKIYVDKTGLIAYANSVLGTEDRFICVSRPRRFGKSMAAGMLAAYYDRSVDSSEMFAPFEIARH
ncbi:MAG: AAA family ATPase, partial [Acidobacteriota bacterium]|nr:AAA family ATPase [Acidobacteriota bacterium]